MIDYHFYTIDDRKVTRNAIQRTRALFILKKLSVNLIKELNLNMNQSKGNLI